MSEIPNLIYIEQLADGQLEVRLRLLRILRTEFPEEVEMYQSYMQASDFILTAEMVHKLKHKFALLGLEKAYEMAVNYEEQLRRGEADLKPNFEEVLNIIDSFLLKIQD